MFGGNTYWWLGLLVFVAFVGVTVGVWALRNKPKLSYTIVWCIAAFFFVYKIGEYTYHQCAGEHMDFPVEFSALSYFTLAITVLFGCKRGDQFGALVAILSGMMYSISFWVSPDSFWASNSSTPFLFAMAAINHHLLYFAGMLLVANCRRYSPKQCWTQAVGVGVFVAYSWLIYKTTPYEQVIGKPIIIKITDGSILTYVVAPEKINAGWLALYYVAAVLLLCLIIVGFYALNMWQCKRREKRGLPVDAFARGVKIFDIK